MPRLCDIDLGLSDQWYKFLDDAHRGVAIRWCEENDLETLYPGYKIWPEWYSGYYEIEVEKSFSCSSASALHEHVVAIAEMLEAGYETGKEQIGADFCR